MRDTVARISASNDPMAQADREIIRFWNERVRERPDCRVTRRVRAVIVRRIAEL